MGLARVDLLALATAAALTRRGNDTDAMPGTLGCPPWSGEWREVTRWARSSTTT